MNDNGILSRIPRQYVAAALNILPAPTATSEEFVEMEYPVPNIGRIHFTARRYKGKRGGITGYFWSMTRAMLVE